MNQYEELRKRNVVGYAHLYLIQCKKESKPDDQIDVQIYSMLVELDTKIGTAAAEQLTNCLKATDRSDMIKVSFFSLNVCFKIILDYQL